MKPVSIKLWLNSRLKTFEFFGNTFNEAYKNLEPQTMLLEFPDHVEFETVDRYTFRTLSTD